MILQEPPNIRELKSAVTKVLASIEAFENDVIGIADVRTGILGDVVLDLFGQRRRRFRVHILVVPHEVADDAQLRLHFGRLDIERSSGVESADVALNEL